MANRKSPWRQSRGLFDSIMSASNWGASLFPSQQGSSQPKKNFQLQRQTQHLPTSYRKVERALEMLKVLKPGMNLLHIVPGKTQLTK